MEKERHAHPWTPERRAKFMATVAKKRADGQSEGINNPKPPSGGSAKPKNQPSLILRRGYAEVIHDLEQQRDILNRAIDALREIA